MIQFHLIRQGEGNEGVTQRFFCDFRMSAGCNDYVLFSISPDEVRHRCRVSASGQTGLPQFLSCLHVEPTNVGIGRAGDEDNSGGGNDGPAQADRARWNLLRVGTAEILHRA